MSLQNVLITSSGAWKLGGFSFAIAVDQSGDSANVQVFHFAVSYFFFGTGFCITGSTFLHFIFDASLF